MGARQRSLPELRGAARSAHAGLVPRAQRRHLHRPGAGPLDRHRQRRLRRLRRRVHPGRQQDAAGPGAVRGRRPVAENPNAEGPQYFGATYPIKAVSTESGTVRDQLEHEPRRRQRDLDLPRAPPTARGSGLHGAGSRTPRVRADFWNPSTLGYSDTGLTPGTPTSTGCRHVTRFGNTANSAWTPVTVAGSGTDSDYVEACVRRRADALVAARRRRRSGRPAADDRVGFQTLTDGCGRGPRRRGCRGR